MNKILVVVDMQNDFLTGALANESAVKIIPNIKREIESGLYDLIVFTRDTHHSDYLETQEGKRLPYIHCVEYTNGWEVCKELVDASEGKYRIFIDKPTFGFNGWKDRLDYLAINGNDCEFTFTGTCTDICVQSNAVIVKSTFPEANVKCIANCCAPFGLTLEDQTFNQEAAFRMMTNQQVDVIR